MPALQIGWMELAYGKHFEFFGKTCYFILLRKFVNSLINKINNFNLKKSIYAWWCIKAEKKIIKLNAYNI